eukprot:g47537.t1
MDNLMMLYFHPKHIKEAIPYGHALYIHRISTDEEEHDRHLKILKDVLIRMGYNAQLLNHQFQCVTAKNHNNLLQRQTQDTTDRVPCIAQFFPGVERLRHVLCSLQHVIDDDKHLTKIIPTPPILSFKQLPNLKQPNVCSKLLNHQDSIDHNITQSCHDNLCKTCQIVNINTTITRGNTTHMLGCPKTWYFGETMQMLQQRMIGRGATITRQECYLPIGEHFTGQGHSTSDLRSNTSTSTPQH